MTSSEWTTVTDSGKTMRTRSLVLATAALAFSLGACSTGPPEEDPDKIADVAVGALEEEVGQRPDDFDCGDDPVVIEEGNTVDCVLTAGSDTLDATVTISNVDGNDYRVNVEVADTVNP